MPKLKRGPQRPLTPEDLRDALAETSRDIAGHFNARFAKIDVRLDGIDKRLDRVDQRLDGVDARFDRLDHEMREGFRQVDVKLDAIMELLATRKQLHNLVRELRAQGLKLDETAIFAE